MGCRAPRARNDLVRFTLDEEATLRVDYRRIAPGRGAWLCPRPDCLRQAIKRGAFARSLRRRVTVPTYDALRREIDEALRAEVEKTVRSARRAGVSMAGMGTDGGVGDEGPPAGGAAEESAWQRSVARARDRYRTWQAAPDEPGAGMAAQKERNRK